ncbi:YlbF/YmcA family competence regulator, partial [Streptococcus pneumoniae]|nr:YlbF/YmcA family competence regulator [Streptococcus pneumoniae]
AHTGQMPDASFQAKMEGFGKQIQGNSLLSEFFTKQQQLAIYLSDIEKIVFEPVSELLK